MRATVVLSATAAIVLSTVGAVSAAPVDTPVNFRGDASGKCLDVYWGGTEDGRPIVQYNCEGQTSQQFRLTRVGDTIAIKTFADKCWDLKGGSTADKTQVIQWPCNGQPNQAFDMTQRGTSSYVFVHPASGKCLGIAGPFTDNNAPLVLMPCDSPTVQPYEMTVVG